MNQHIVINDLCCTVPYKIHAENFVSKQYYTCILKAFFFNSLLLNNECHLTCDESLGYRFKRITLGFPCDCGEKKLIDIDNMEYRKGNHVNSCFSSNKDMAGISLI